MTSTGIRYGAAAWIPSLAQSREIARALSECSSLTSHLKSQACVNYDKTTHNVLLDSRASRINLNRVAGKNFIPKYLQPKGIEPV